MLGFPNQKEVSLIIGNKLTMVCCNANQVYLHFDSDISISIELHPFKIKTDNEIIETNIPLDNLAIFDFLEIKVIDIKVNASNSIFEIVFENNKTIILSDDVHYESHVIKIGSKEFIV